MPFDPKKFIATHSAPSGGFDPKAFIAKHAPPSWLDKDVLGVTPRGLIQGTADALPVAGSIAGGFIGGTAGSVVPGAGTLAGSLTGAGLGGMTGSTLKNALESAIGKAPTRAELYTAPLKGGVEGMANELGGQLLGAAATKYGPPVAKSAMQVMLGVPRESIDAYLANAARIKDAPSLVALKDKIDTHMAKLRGAVDGATEGVGSAKGINKDIENQISQVQRDAGLEWNSLKPEWQESARQAKQNLSLAQQEAKQNISQSQAEAKQNWMDTKTGLEKNHASQNAQAKEAVQNKIAELQATPHPLTMADDVVDSVKDLKNQVVQGSAEARRILGESGVTVPMDGVEPIIDEALRSLEVNGKAPVTPSAQKTYNALQGLKKNFSNFVGDPSEVNAVYGAKYTAPPPVPGAQAKKLIQQLDDDIDYQRGAGEFTSKYSQTLRQIRQHLDSVIKGVPEYEAQMADVSKKTGLLDQANDLFGDKGSALAKLNSIHKPTAAVNREVLEQLGEVTGKDFRTPVSNYEQAQNTLKGTKFEPLPKPEIPQLQMPDSTLPDLPQAGPARDADILSTIIDGKNPELKAFHVQNAVQESGLPHEQELARQELALRQQSLDQAQTQLEPFRNITPQNSQERLETLMRARGESKEELRRQLGALGQNMGEDLVDGVEARKVADSFEKGAMHGSRNVVLGGVLGGVGSHFIAHAGPELGAAMTGIGSLTGAAIDRYGPKMAQYTLDAALNPTVQQGAKLLPRTAVSPWFLMNSSNDNN